VSEQHHLGRVRVAFQPGGAAFIGQQQRSFSQIDTVGQFIARREAVEQRGAAARHQDAHVGDHPVGRIARRQSHAVAPGDAVIAHQTFRNAGGSGVGLPEGQADIAIDQKGQILVLIGKMREIMRQCRRGGCEGGHGDPVAHEWHRGKRLTLGRQAGDDRFERIVQLGGHPVIFLSRCSREARLRARA
jgi:hypothetical protein